MAVTLDDYETITPDIARQMLETNTHNRDVGDVHVKSLALKMKNGTFTISAAPIMFDVNGRLIDGQHRLMAAIEADATFKALVIKGLPTWMYGVVDDGVRLRRAKQLMQNAYTADRATLISYILHYEKLNNLIPSGRMSRLGAPQGPNYQKPTILEILAYDEEHPEVADYVDTYKTLAGKFARGKASVTAVNMLIAGWYCSKQEEFWADVQAFITNGGLPEGNPIGALAQMHAPTSNPSQMLIERALAMSIAYRDGLKRNTFRAKDSKMFDLRPSITPVIKAGSNKRALV